MRLHLIAALATPQEIAAEIGERIRLTRIGQGISLEAMAERCGVDVSAVQELEGAAR